MLRFLKKYGAALMFAALMLVLGACTNPGGAETQPAQSSPVGNESGEPTAVPTEPERSSPPVAAGSPSASPTPTPAPVPTQTPEPTPTPTPTPDVPEKVSGLMGLGEPVEGDWFADAVFVGDSRTDGLRLYSGIKGTTFISHQGLSVFNIGSKECIERNGATVTVLAALGEQEYAKIYLMLGVNELGYDSESFRRAYTSLVQQIEEIQPNATIYLQTVLPVNEPKAASHGISSAINNSRVKLFNEVIADIAEAEGTALVDVAALFWTDAGEMDQENTSDGVHLTRKGYTAWYEYLKSHTGTTEPVEEPPVTDPDPVESKPPVTDPEPAESEPPVTDPEPGESGSPAANPEPVESEPPAAEAEEEQGL